MYGKLVLDCKSGRFMDDAVRAPQENLQPALFEPPEAGQDLIADALALRRKAVPRNTASAYRIAWDTFSDFCADATRNYRRLPASPGAVAEYLTALHRVRHVSVSTMKQHRAAIRHYHQRAGHLDPNRSPLVTDVWKGILIEADQQAPAITYALWRQAVDAVVAEIDREQKSLGRFAPPAARLACVRDRALVLALSSSARLTAREIHTLRLEEIVSSEGGLDVRVQRSPDAFGKPRLTTMKFNRGPMCPVEALSAWLRQADLDGMDAQGPVFRPILKNGRLGPGSISPHHLLGIVKRRCALAGIDPHLISMRALRSGSMVQDGYDGTTIETILSDAGLSEESRPRITALAARGELRRKRGQLPPAGVDAIPVNAGRIVISGRKNAKRA